MKLLNLGNERYGVRCDHCRRLGVDVRKYALEEARPGVALCHRTFLCDGCVREALADILRPVFLADQTPPAVTRTGPGEYRVYPGDPNQGEG